MVVRKQVPGGWVPRKQRAADKCHTFSVERYVHIALSSTSKNLTLDHTGQEPSIDMAHTPCSLVVPRGTQPSPRSKCLHCTSLSTCEKLRCALLSSSSYKNTHMRVEIHTYKYNNCRQHFFVIEKTGDHTNVHS